MSDSHHVFVDRSKFVHSKIKVVNRELAGFILLCVFCRQIPNDLVFSCLHLGWGLHKLHNFLGWLACFLRGHLFEGLVSREFFEFF